MQIPARLSEKRWHMASCTLSLSIEECLPTFSGTPVETASRRERSEERKLVGMESRQFRSDQIWGTTDISKSIPSCNREFARIIQSWIVECSFTVHRKIGNESIPVGDGTPTCPCVEIDTSQTERRREQGSSSFAIR